MQPRPQPDAARRRHPGPRAHRMKVAAERVARAKDPAAIAKPPRFRADARANRPLSARADRHRTSAETDKVRNRPRIQQEAQKTARAQEEAKPSHWQLATLPRAPTRRPSNGAQRARQTLMSTGAAVCQAPRVKSGTSIGMPPCATDCSESGPITLHAQPSYTLWSSGRPSRRHCTIRQRIT